MTNYFFIIVLESGTDITKVDVFYKGVTHSFTESVFSIELDTQVNDVVIITVNDNWKTRYVVSNLDSETNVSILIKDQTSADIPCYLNKFNRGTSIAKNTDDITGLGTNIRRFGDILPKGGKITDAQYIVSESDDFILFEDGGLIIQE